MAFAEGELERAATPAEIKYALRRILIEVRLDADGRTPLVDADLRLIADPAQPFYVDPPDAGERKQQPLVNRSDSITRSVTLPPLAIRAWRGDEASTASACAGRGRS